MPLVTERKYIVNLVVSENKDVLLYGYNYVKYRLPRFAFLNFIFK